MNESDIMNWPVDVNWRCERCELQVHWLLWDIPHGYCYCSVCGANYRMKDGQDKRVTTPISNTREEWRPVLKEFWELHKVPEWMMTAKHWNECEKKINEQIVST